MIQFNLLPDIKYEFQRAQRTKRLIMLSSLSVIVIFSGFFIAMFTVVKVIQTQHIANLNKDINEASKELQNPDLQKVLTIQNQLSSLQDLHDKKPVVSRLQGYLLQLVPSNATLSDVSLDFADNSIQLKGEADSIELVNKFVDTLKFTDYQIGQGNKQKAFSEVVLTSYSLASEKTSSQKISYDVSFKFNPDIFKITKKEDGTLEQVVLVIPQTITTRSVTEKPTELFKPAPITNTQQ